MADESSIVASEVLNTHDMTVKLLKKKGSERMTIEKTLEHEWIKKYAKEDILENKKKSNDNAGKAFEIYSSVGENK